MKIRLFALASALLASAALPALAADVGVSVQISQPGVYGRVDIGRYPQPQMVVAQPVLITRPQVVVMQPEPVYLWVPPGHRKHWRNHCGAYGACGVPVYFVQHGWYRQNVYDGRHEHHEPQGRGKGRGKGQGKGHGHD